MLKGKKTIFAGIFSIVLGVGGLVTGQLDSATAGQYVLGGLSVIFLRLGIKGETEK